MIKKLLIGLIIGVGSNELMALTKPSLQEAKTQQGQIDSTYHFGWAQCGLAQTAINSLGVSRVDDQIIFAANDDNGIYRSLNGGALWENVCDEKNVFAFEFDPLKAEVVYALQPQAILRSTTKGRQFRKLFEVSTPGAFVITSMLLDRSLGVKSQIILVGTSNGVFKSLNGETFNRAGLQELHVNALAEKVMPGQKPTLFAATKNGLFYSQNYGLSWRPSLNGLPQTNLLQVMVDFKQPGNVYVVSEERGLYKSNDGGESWVPMAQKVPQLGGFRLAQAVDEKLNRTVLYLTNFSGEVFKSEDSANTWIKMGSKINNVGLCIALSSLVPTPVYIGTLSGVYKYPIEK